MAHQPQEIARGTRADSSRGFTEVPSPRNEQAWLANPFQALRFLKPAYETYRKETPGREVTRQPACTVKPETWRSSWSPTSARGTLHARLLCPETPTSCCGEDARIGAAGTSLSSTQETARRRDHSPGCRILASRGCRERSRGPFNLRGIARPRPADMTSRAS